MIARILAALGKGLTLPLLLAAALVAMRCPSAGAQAAVGQADKVTCMYPVWVGFGPVHLANELGYFREEGIEVEEILDDDMPNGIAAMERGDIDCYLRTVGEYQGLGRRKDTQGTIIGTIDLSTGGDGWAADGAIKSVCDLKGKTIAVEPNLPARLIMQMALKKDCNLSIKDTNLDRHRRRRCDRRVRRPERRRGRHLRAGAQPGGRDPCRSRRPHPGLVQGLRGPDPGRDLRPQRRAQGQPAEVRQVSARRLSRGRLLQRAPGGGDPDHRPALLDHGRRLQGDPAELPLHALKPRRSS